LSLALSSPMLRKVIARLGRHSHQRSVIIYEPSCSSSSGTSK
jgi:hypothetical protein